MATGQSRVNERVLSLDFECLRSLPGGMNEVRVWRDKNLGCNRVGKRIDLMGLDDVLPEAATLQQINHDNVVKILAAPEVHDSTYPPPMRVIELVTPYYPRGSITDALLRGEQFTATQAIGVIQAALRGLGALHDVHGVAHRDIKSGNILLADDSTIVAMVADLGLAGKFDADGNVPALNNPTLYSPPEVATTRQLTRASDLFPIGLIFIELLCGHFDYSAYRTTDIQERLMKGKSAVLPSDFQPPVWASRSLRRFLNKTLKLQPSERFQLAGAMDNALADVRVLDWNEVEHSAWEAPFLHRPGVRIRVEAHKQNLSGFAMRTLVDRGKGWRRPSGWSDQEVDRLDSTAARRLFDQATDMAIVR